MIAGASAMKEGEDMCLGGQKLRLLRDQLGLTMRDVENASAQIAERHSNDEFSIPPSRLSDIETKNVLPSIFRLYSFAVIYRQDIRELMAWYGVDLNGLALDLDVTMPPKSHVSEALANLSSVQMPLRLDPSFDPRRTVNFGRMVEQWGLVPLAYLAQFASCQYTYGYIGSEDLTMYPILPPGSFVQVDESRNRVLEGGWRSEYERPIYFVETREGHVCCWCTVTREEVILQPHPLSPVAARALRYPQQAEVIGQVVGVAIKLGDWRPVFDSSVDSKAHEALN
jgi:transcriptional regulator with XRE-family HTH domain